uniref:MHC class I-like antigen recognition-like domain-containing protein n=1 Tax=Amphiprion percula TaxID=161767 RepID=A0A3P8SXU3_AMPPE
MLNSKAENLLFLPVKHSLMFFVTSVGYCDSNIRRPELRRDWMRTFIKDDPQHLEWYVNKCIENQHFFRATIDNLMNRFNQSVHILQQMSGCEWDDETGESRGFNQYGYDGEDFIALDLQTLTWIAPKPQAFITKLRWDADKARRDDNKYFIHLYPDWLKKYVQYARSFLQRTGRITQPEIHTNVILGHENV